MKTLKKILVPVDFSDCSRAAVQSAIGLAGRYGAELELLHVHEVPFTAGAVLVRAADGREVSMEVFLAEESKRLLDEMVESVDDIAEAVHHEVVRGGVAHISIVDRARQIGADLIVMGTHGRSGLSHLLMGSVAEKVLRSAPCPVLVVRDRYEED